MACCAGASWRRCSRRCAPTHLKGKAPAAFDLLFWNGDDTNLPDPMYCWYVRNTYLENRLREPGGTVQCGVPVDLSRIAGVINPPAKRKRSHWIGDLAPEAEAWLDGAESVEGNWWPAWSDWLATHAGALVAARRVPGNAEFPVIEAAPGRYVKTPAA